MEPTQVAEKPVSDLRSGSGLRSDQGQNRSPSPVYVREPDYWFSRVPADVRDLGDDMYDSDDEIEEEEPGGTYDCPICDKEGVRHLPAECPCFRNVSLNATLPPSVSRVCQCCGLKDGHPGRTDWKAWVVMKECRICCTRLKHWTDECPNKYQVDKKAPAPQHAKLALVPTNR